MGSQMRVSDQCAVVAFRDCLGAAAARIGQYLLGLPKIGDPVLGLFLGPSS